MLLFRKLTIILIVIWVSVGAHTQTQASKTDPAFVDLTWFSNTNWFFETGNTRILMDGFITRLPRPPKRPDLSDPETLSMPAMTPDTAAVRRVIRALIGTKKLNYIISGHSHFDHSFDTAVLAKLTGAHIIGPRSTCLQAFAQGIPESQCTIVEGGETFDLGSGLSVGVVVWHHSGDPSTPFGLFLQTPMELVDAPTPDPVTGGLRAGPWEDFPNGGGAWAYLFTLAHPEHPVHWFYTNSGNSETFRNPQAVDETFLQEYGLTMNNLVIIPQKTSVEENLIAAMNAEKLDGIHLLIGYNSRKHVEQLIPILKPKAFIPQHWGGVWSPFFDGLTSEYSYPSLEELLHKEGIGFYPQSQYMDKYRLNADGITPIPNDEMKQQLGF